MTAVAERAGALEDRPVIDELDAEPRPDDAPRTSWTVTEFVVAGSYWTAAKPGRSYTFRRDHASNLWVLALYLFKVVHGTAPDADGWWRVTDGRAAKHLYGDLESAPHRRERAHRWRADLGAIGVFEFRAHLKDDRRGFGGIEFRPLPVPDDIVDRAALHSDVTSARSSAG